jgi:hypothetical protein
VSDADGNMTRIVEKPTEPISKRANIGLYYMKNWQLLYEGIDHVLTRPKNKGEYYLTDAFQYMIEHGAKIRVVDVAGWYDAGQMETLLDTNRAMLERGRARRPDSLDASATIIEPVYIEDGVTIRDSTIGPNVSLSSGATIEGSTLRDTIVGAQSRVTGSRLHGSIIGDAVKLEGLIGSVTVGDHSEIRAVMGIHLVSNACNMGHPPHACDAVPVDLLRARPEARIAPVAEPGCTSPTLFGYQHAADLLTHLCRRRPRRLPRGCVRRARAGHLLRRRGDRPGQLPRLRHR